MSPLNKNMKKVVESRLLKMWTLLFLSLIMVSQIAGQRPQPHQKHSSRKTAKQKPSIPATTAGRTITIDDQQLVIPDLLLTDQDGKKVRFYTDLLKDKTFVLGFFFTNCTYICVRQGSLFSALQRKLGERLGKDAFIISVTMDPQTDTVAKLNAWAARYGRRPGWTMVTGSVSEMNKLLIAFTGQKAGPKDIHSGQIFIVNDSTGRWTYVDELASPAEVEKRINELGLLKSR